MTVPKKKQAAVTPTQRRARALRILKVVVSGYFTYKTVDHPMQLKMQIETAIELLEQDL